MMWLAIVFFPVLILFVELSSKSKNIEEQLESELDKEIHKLLNPQFTEEKLKSTAKHYSTNLDALIRAVVKHTNNFTMGNYECSVSYSEGEHCGWQRTCIVTTPQEALAQAFLASLQEKSRHIPLLYQAVS